MPGDVCFSGVCDCHVHIVGPVGRFPQSPSRSYTAGVAALDTLRTVAEPLGVSRFVIVQASFYGNDNACLLDTLDSLGDKGSAVAMLDPIAAAPKLLQDYALRGVRGLRVNLYSKSLASGRGATGDLLEAAIKNAAVANWHVEIVATLSTLLSAAREIADSKVPIVIDHYGLPGELAPDSREGRTLLDLVALPHVWVKLAAPYRIAGGPLSTKPPANWLKALVRQAPERCVWGSDWPHTPLEHDQRGATVAAPYRAIDYSSLFTGFVEAIEDAGLAESILVTNPARLYGFPLPSKEKLP
jgi:predicted TIM-barrel fold metal-dependent hydrolase